MTMQTKRQTPTHSGFLCFSVFLFLCLTVFHCISQYFPETRFFAKNSLCDVFHFHQFSHIIIIDNFNHDNDIMPCTGSFSQSLSNMYNYKCFEILFETCKTVKTACLTIIYSMLHDGKQQTQLFNNVIVN